LLSGRSPFTADRNPIHHCLLDLGMWHSQAAFTLNASNIGFIGLAWFCRELRPVQFLAISLGSAFLLSQLPF